MGEWQPLYERHAIVMMAAVASFSGALTDIGLRRVLKASAEVASKAGLSASSPIFSLEINPASPALQAGKPAGHVYNSVEDAPVVPGLQIDFTRQLLVDPSSVIFRTSRYRSWAEEKAEIGRIFAPLLEITSSIVGLSAIRLEYLDRFVFQGDAGDAKVGDLLLSESGLISPHVFGRTGPWHANTGYLVPAEGKALASVVQLNVECVNIRSTPIGSEQVAVNVMSAQEDRNPKFGVAEDAYDAHFVLERFEEMHTRLKDLLAHVITSDMQRRIGMKLDG